MLVTVPSGTIPEADAFAGFVTTVLLVGLLIAKETTTSVTDDQGRRFGWVLDVALLPLLITFAILIATKVVPD